MAISHASDTSTMVPFGVAELVPTFGHQARAKHKAWYRKASQAVPFLRLPYARQLPLEEFKEFASRSVLQPCNRPTNVVLPGVGYIHEVHSVCKSDGIAVESRIWSVRPIKGHPQSLLE